MNNDVKYELKMPTGKLFGPREITDIYLLRECAISCKAAYKKFLEKKIKRPALICAESAEIHDLAVKFLTCGSEFSSPIIKLCKLISERCEEECLKMEEDVFKLCAQECRRCIDFFSSPKNKKLKIDVDFEQNLE